MHKRSCFAKAVLILATGLTLIQAPSLRDLSILVRNARSTKRATCSTALARFITGVAFFKGALLFGVFDSLSSFTFSPAASVSARRALRSTKYTCFDFDFK